MPYRDRTVSKIKDDSQSDITVSIKCQYIAQPYCNCKWDNKKSTKDKEKQINKPTPNNINEKISGENKKRS